MSIEFRNCKFIPDHLLDEPEPKPVTVHIDSDEDQRPTSVETRATNLLSTLRCRLPDGASAIVKVEYTLDDRFEPGQSDYSYVIGVHVRGEYTCELFSALFGNREEAIARLVQNAKRLVRLAKFDETEEAGSKLDMSRPDRFEME